MDNSILKYNINPLVSAIGKTPDQFTKEDIINFITANDIRVVNFRYIAGDGRLKTLNFPVSSLQYLDLILSFGERVDGSSLFSYIQAGSSDLYVIPRFSTAYLDPFAEIPTLGLLCSYFTKDGLPLESSPARLTRSSRRPPATPSRPWASWSSTSSMTTTAASPRRISADTMSPHLSPRSRHSAPRP